MSGQQTGWAHRASAAEDIDVIYDSLAYRLREEFEIAEGKFPWLNIRQAAINLATQHQSRTFAKDGKLMVVMGWQPVTHGYATAFLAVEDYFHGGLSDVRYSRRAIEKLQAELGNTKLVANSYGQHPSLAAWFRAMGYENCPSEADYKVFVKWPRHPA